MTEDALGPRWLTALGHRDGPLCHLCNRLPSTIQHQEYGMICISCKRMIDSNLISWYWGTLVSSTQILINDEITRLIADFIWGEGMCVFCYCGQCPGSWLLSGWICYGRAPFEPVAENDA